VSARHRKCFVMVQTFFLLIGLVIGFKQIHLIVFVILKSTNPNANNLYYFIFKFLNWDVAIPFIHSEVLKKLLLPSVLQDYTG
jgi:hypothetical protein